MQCIPLIIASPCLEKKTDVLTVLGFGSSILCKKFFAPAENQNGQVKSAAFIYKFKEKEEKQQQLIKKLWVCSSKYFCINHSAHSKKNSHGL